MSFSLNSIRLQSIRIDAVIMMKIIRIPEEADEVSPHAAAEEVHARQTSNKTAPHPEARKKVLQDQLQGKATMVIQRNFPKKNHL